MGCLFVLVLGGVSAAMIFIFGYHFWVMVVLGVLWLAALLYSALFGHRGFGGGGNTDLTIMLAGVFLAAAMIIPHYNDQKPCNQPKIALKKLADAEYHYFSEHKAFTPELSLLDLPSNPDISIRMIKGDKQSFIAAASHRLCDKDKSGTPDVFMWDSARGGLQ
jgi:hypothetical protein